jgi:uncharacterized protein YjiK
MTISPLLTALQTKLHQLQQLRLVLIWLATLSIVSCANQPKAPLFGNDKPDESPVNVAKLIPSFNGLTLISEYTNSTPAMQLKEIGSNASGITWDPYQKQYFVVQNNAAFIYRYNRNFEFLGKLKKVGNINNDIEGLSYLDGHNILLATEANYAHKIEFDEDVFARQYYNASINFRIDERPARKNKGLESIAFRPAKKNRFARVYVAHEGSGRYDNAKMKIVYFNAKYLNGSSGNYDFFDNNDSKLTVPFDAEHKFAGVITDIAGMTFDPLGKTLIIVSQESKKAIQVDPESGEIISQLKLSGAPQFEGVTIGPGGQLVFVSERNWVKVYSKRTTNQQ